MFWVNLIYYKIYQIVIYIPNHYGQLKQASDLWVPLYVADRLEQTAFGFLICSDMISDIRTAALHSEVYNNFWIFIYSKC